MYDKIKIWLDLDLLQEQGTTPETIASLLSTPEETFDRNTRECDGCKGYLCGFYVRIFIYRGVSICGSLSRFMYGDNTRDLDRHDTEKAIQKLGSIMHLDLNDAKVTALEYGKTFPMKYNVSLYLDRLGEIPRLTRVSCTDSTLYYRHKCKKKDQPKEICIYDKGAEKQEKGQQIPSILKGCNLLRYEIRYSKKLAKQLGFDVVTISMLFDLDFCKLLSSKWVNYYKSILKQSHIKTNAMEEIKKVSDAKAVFFAQILYRLAKFENQSEQIVIKAFIDDLKANNKFTDRKYYSRLKNELQEISAKSTFTETDELIQELNDAIQNADMNL